MARVYYIENPSQADGCLAGAMQDYIARIPARFSAFEEAVTWIASLRFEPDTGAQGTDTRCFPAQRARVWPETINCWEATAHIAAEGKRLLPEDWSIVIRDATVNGRRHVWPTIELPRILGPLNPVANVTGNDVFGGVHVLGRAVLRGFGLDALGEVLEQVEQPILPDWAKPSPAGPGQPTNNPRSTGAPMHTGTAPEIDDLI